ncbi:hypothetical protein SAMN02983003_1285 [Devosia enhydra]|uniref:DUF2065 domain-containing protein n=1 Tax=Devosia enhydra TaxID=665118 RepID=A0A1K2HX62_9HYPH|nr:DUF2065 domain-containing protein [Devosia enhydra]SFZ82802.1 hypothetical protein SAMN02983003_1285 [Devosia enhydra]
MIELLSALALALALEGLVYAAFPDQMKRMLASIESMPASTLRAGGLACAAVALVVLWLLRGG